MANCGSVGCRPFWPRMLSATANLWAPMRSGRSVRPVGIGGIDPVIASHRGRIVKTTGDGMLVEFASVVGAVRCAVDVQRGMVERSEAVPPEQRSNSASGSTSATSSAWATISTATV